MLDEKFKTLLYDACSSNDYKTFRENLIFSEINTPLDDQGNTALHIATLHGHAEIVRLLLRYHSNRAVENNEGKLADQMIPNDEIKAIFQAAYRPSQTATDNHYVGDTPEIEWIDTYRNAYRIAFENHEHMKRWITKVPLNELLEEILNNYVEKMTFNTEKCRDEVKTYLDYAIDEGEPLYLVNIYTGTSLFCSKLNEDLAKLGSDFRFVSTRLDYPDNEPPKDLGQYIYASLLINHRVFRDYQYASTTFRGMKLLEDDLEQYGKNKVVITRSFLSTSTRREIAEIYIGFSDIHKTIIAYRLFVNTRFLILVQVFLSNQLVIFQKKTKF
ncbi:hypothetical protein I4U23_009881 [Adineta vaga]|nr:hypothetical protein I4U23_009881 [Adineta vaga]